MICVLPAQKSGAHPYKTTINDVIRVKNDNVFYRHPDTRHLQGSLASHHLPSRHVSSWKPLPFSETSAGFPRLAVSPLPSACDTELITSLALYQTVLKGLDTDSDFNPHPANLIAIAGIFFYFSSARWNWKGNRHRYKLHELRLNLICEIPEAHNDSLHSFAAILYLCRPHDLKSPLQTPIPTAA